jgi:hypothetical protein
MFRPVIALEEGPSPTPAGNRFGIIRREDLVALARLVPDDRPAQRRIGNSSAAWSNSTEVVLASWGSVGQGCSGGPGVGVATARAK